MIEVARPFVGDEEVAAVREVLLSGNYVSGQKVAEFEKAFAEFVGTQFAVAVNSGTAALHLILAALGVGPGDEVIVPPLSFFSSVSCVLHQNAIPVFADINPESYCLDSHDVEKKITEQTRAIIIVHLFGQAADMDAFGEIADTRGVSLIEDCAQAHGTKYGGNIVGSLGTAGAFSFFATKHMTTGEGGLITTNNPDLAEKARLMRSHGMTDRDTHAYLGYNYRMNEMAAAMGLVQLKKLSALNKKRIQNSLYLIEELKETPWLVAPRMMPSIEHSFFWVPFWVKEEVIGISTPDLVSRLRENGVQVRHRYKEPLYRQPILLDQNGFGDRHLCPYQCPHYAGPNVDYSQVRLTAVEKVAGRLIGLPNHPGLTDEELGRVADVIKELFRGKT
jgi:perosamine synthetase